MEISVERETFVKVLSIMSRAVKKNNIIQPLEGIVVTPTKEGLEVRGSNLRTSISAFVSASVDGSDTFVVPLKNLFEITRRLSGEELHFKFMDGKLLLRDKSSDYSFTTYAADEYPDIVWSINGEKITVPSKLLLRCINETYFASIPNTDYAPSYSQGIQMEMRDSKFGVVASDGQRLAMSWFDAVGVKSACAMIPAVSVSEIMPVLSLSELVDIVLGEKYVFFGVSDISMVVTRLNIKIPEYNAVVEKIRDTENVAVVDRLSLIGALERISYISSDSYLVRIDFGDDLLLQSVGSASGSGRESVRCEYTGDGISVYLSIKHLLVVLKNLSSENIKILVRHEMVGVEKYESQDFIYVVSTASVGEESDNEE